MYYIEIADKERSYQEWKMVRARLGRLQPSNGSRSWFWYRKGAGRVLKRLGRAFAGTTPDGSSVYVRWEE